MMVGEISVFMPENNEIPDTYQIKFYSSDEKTKNLLNLVIPKDKWEEIKEGSLVSITYTLSGKYIDIVLQSE
jgi:hypothetical protein